MDKTIKKKTDQQSLFLEMLSDGREVALLLVLEFLEREEQYETCHEILLSICKWNTKHPEKFVPTKLSGYSDAEDYEESNMMITDIINKYIIDGVFSKETEDTLELRVAIDAIEAISKIYKLEMEVEIV